MGEEKIDFTRGGRYPNPAPDSFYDKEGLSYWEKMNQFVDYLDSSLPPGFSLSNTSAYRENKVVDKNGNVVSTGKSHTTVPSHDFVIRSSEEGYEPDEDELWSMYQNILQPLAQNFGIRADGRQFVNGKRHGTAPHLHLQSGGTGYPKKGDSEDLSLRTSSLLEALKKRKPPKGMSTGGIVDTYGRRLI